MSAISDAILAISSYSQLHLLPYFYSTRLRCRISSTVHGFIAHTFVLLNEYHYYITLTHFYIVYFNFILTACIGMLRRTKKEREIFNQRLIRCFHGCEQMPLLIHLTKTPWLILCFQLLECLNTHVIDCFIIFIPVIMKYEISVIMKWM